MTARRVVVPTPGCWLLTTRIGGKLEPPGSSWLASLLDLAGGECVLSRRVVPQSINPSVLGPEAACVQGKRRLGRPSVESLGAGESGRTLTTGLEGRVPR